MGFDGPEPAPRGPNAGSHAPLRGDLGCAAGIALTAALGRVVSGMLYGISTHDPMTLAGVVAIVIAVSVGASLVPALRASRLDLTRILREE